VSHLTTPATGRAPGAWQATVATLIVVSAIVVGTATPVYATTDLYWARQWAPVQIGAPAAWRRTTGTGVRIGVVDTGIDLEHEDLSAKVVASTSCLGTGGNSASCRGSAQDDNGHGTAVSSIAAAVTGNGKGIAGVAPGAELVVARSLTDNGHGGAVGDSVDVLAGVDWVVAHGARIVNLSLGTDAGEPAGPSPMAPAIERAWARGAIPVVAAGNGTPDERVSAYANLDAVVVGASDRDGGRAPYSLSLRGTKWGLLAPGGSGGDPRSPGYLARNVVSAIWVGGQSSSYGASSGTSVAAPHVAGALALLLAQGLTRESAIQHLIDTAVNAGPCGSGCHGRLDVAGAVGSVGGAPPPTTVGTQARGLVGGSPTQPDGGAPVPGAAAVPPSTDVAVTTPPSPPAPLPSDDQGGTAADRSLALPEPGSSLQLASAPGSDALVPPPLLVVVAATTVVSSVLLEWLARRDRGMPIRSMSGPDPHHAVDGGGASHPR